MNSFYKSDPSGWQFCKAIFNVFVAAVVVVLYKCHEYNVQVDICHYNLGDITAIVGSVLEVTLVSVIVLCSVKNNLPGESLPMLRHVNNKVKVFVEIAHFATDPLLSLNLKG